MKYSNAVAYQYDCHIFINEIMNNNKRNICFQLYTSMPLAPEDGVFSMYK